MSDIEKQWEEYLDLKKKAEKINTERNSIKAIDWNKATFFTNKEQREKILSDIKTRVDFEQHYLEECRTNYEKFPFKSDEPLGILAVPRKLEPGETIDQRISDLDDRITYIEKSTKNKT